GGPSGQPRSFVSAEGSLSLHVPRPPPPGCPGAVPVPAGPQAPPVRCPGRRSLIWRRGGGVAVQVRKPGGRKMLVVSDEALDTAPGSRCPPSAPGRIQARSIVRQEYPELVDLAARPRLTRRPGSRTKSAGRMWIVLPARLPRS